MKYHLACCLIVLSLSGCTYKSQTVIPEQRLVADNQHCLNATTPGVRKFLAPALGLYLAKPSQEPANAAYHSCMREKGW
ncbi:hypothetical protein [Zobellella sp. An-6]|uniref:hypothetical protein n=1 Tax=Zobellella sp. An-6 TaxID=3400218 RepID=UPI004041D264